MTSDKLIIDKIKNLRVLGIENKKKIHIFSSEEGKILKTYGK